MELNEPVEGHEHATTSLKVVMLVFAVVLIGALAYLMQATYSQPEAEENAPKVKDKTEQTTSSTSETQTTTDETADWKTYTSSRLGVSTKYPEAQLFPGEYSQLDSVLFFNTKAELDGFKAEGLGTTGESQVQVQVFDNVTLETHKKALTNEKVYTVAKNSDYKLALAGITATRIESTHKEFSGETYAEGTKVIYVIFEKDLKVYELAYVQKPAQKDSSAVFEKMLLTFNFTK